MNAQTNTLQLSDSRVLSYTEYGSADGSPILYFHGFPSSRLEALSFRHLQSLPYRLIAIDRPGMGLSTINPTATLSSWANDIAEFTEKLSLNKFSILAYSGGAPFALACAALMKDKINNCVIVSGFAPLDAIAKYSTLSRPEKILKFLIRFFPFLSKLMMKATYNLLQNPQKMVQELEKKACPLDKAVFANKALCQQIINSTLEAFRNGTAGPAHEMKLLFNACDIDNDAISCPIQLWYGKADHQAGIAHAEAYRGLFPNAQLFLLDEEGHHSLIRNQFEKILQGMQKDDSE